MLITLWQAQTTSADDKEGMSIVIVMLVICLLLFLFGGRKR